MAYLTEPDVQTWLETTKLDIVTVEDGLDSAAYLRVASALSDRYDISSWLDAASTPELVRQVMAMYYAAWYYRRTYSEDTDESPTYADWLEGLADTLLAGLADGSVDIPGLTPITEDEGEPDFYPRDINYDTHGNRVDDAVFQMSQVF